MPPSSQYVRRCPASSADSRGAVDPAMYSSGASCRSATLSFRLTTCQLSRFSTSFDAIRATFPTSRGRWFHVPGVNTGNFPRGDRSGSTSYASLFIITGARPRARNSRAKPVSGIEAGFSDPPGQLPSGAWSATARSAPTLNQSVLPMYFRPPASATRLMPNSV